MPINAIPQLSEFASALTMINPSYTLSKVAAGGFGVCAIATMGKLIAEVIADARITPLREDPYWSFLPFKAIAQDGKTIICTGGSMNHDRYMRVIKLEGAEISLSDPTTHQKLFDSRLAFLNTLNNHGIDHVKIFTLKEQTKLKRHLRPTNPVLNAMDHKWDTGFPMPTRLTHYIVPVATARTQSAALKALNSCEEAIESLLSDYQPSVMIEEASNMSTIDKLREKGDGPLRLFSGIASPLSNSSPIGSHFLKSDRELSSLICTDDLSFKYAKRGIIQFRHGDATKLASIISYADPGDRTSESVMKEIISVDSPLLIYHAIKPIPQLTAQTKLAAQRRSAPIMQLSPDAQAPYDDVIKMTNGIGENANNVLCQYSTHVMILSDTYEKLEKARKEVTEAMHSTHGSSAIATAMAQVTFMSMLDPGSPWPTKFTFPTPNIATCFYPQSSPKGLEKTDWGNEPVAYLPTLNGDPYPFSFHETSQPKAPGHTTIIGATGGGKTVLMELLAANAARFPHLRIFAFDRWQGMKIFTRAISGQYIEFDSESNDELFNPFLMSPSERNSKFLQQWLGQITGITTPEALRSYAEMVKFHADHFHETKDEYKSLAYMAQSSFDSNGEVYKAIEPWISENQYKKIVNAKKESFALDASRFTTFDMTTILDDPILAPPIISYLTHRIYNLSSTTDDPTLLLIDEARALFTNKYFAENFLRMGLLEGRKMRQVYCLCFQDIEGIKQTGHANTILDQSTNKIFFRMKETSERLKALYREVGCNDAEIAFLAREDSFKNIPHCILLKRGGDSPQSVLLNINMKPYQQYFKLFRGGASDANKFDELADMMPIDKAVQTYISQ